jgi:hypothetical protein
MTAIEKELRAIHKEIEKTGGTKLALRFDRLCVKIAKASNKAGSENTMSAIGRDIEHFLQ